MVWDEVGGNTGEKIKDFTAYGRIWILFQVQEEVTERWKQTDILKGLFWLLFENGLNDSEGTC